MANIRRMTPAQLRARETALEAELDARDPDRASRHQAAGILGFQSDAPEYDETADTSEQQASYLLGED